MGGQADEHGLVLDVLVGVEAVVGPAPPHIGAHQGATDCKKKLKKIITQIIDWNATGYVNNCTINILALGFNTGIC